MSIVDCLRWQTFSTVQDESWSTEAKSGVPRYDGDVAKLAEYQFRVRLRQAREKAMDESELQKLGPLALRLVDGLRGPALQVARGLPVDQLAKEEGTSILLKALQATLQPRSKQEARDLYQVGAQSGGVLSRQTGESIPSYVLRRKAWYNLMLDMDASLKLPEGILAEQTLQNSGLSADYQLLVRAAIQGEMTMERLCEELVAQRSRIHERESRSGKGHYNKSYKGYHGKGYGGKDRRPWSRAYHAQGPEEYYECEEWDANSQSLGGYEEYDNEDTAYVMDEDDLICSAYNSMLEDGFDETDYEAAEYAAEVLQAEAEAYFLRSKAGQSGHHGFGGGAARQFQVQGHLTMEERKARVQQLKSKTQCRRCGQTGHWANDPQCPKSFRKGKGKGSSPTSSGSTSTSASPKSGKGSKSGKSDKSRTVYFTINEYEAENDIDPEVHMVVKEETADAEYKDAYQERWNEVYPGHPLFTMEDRDRLQRWLWKATRGLPHIPPMASSPAPPSYGPLSTPTTETCHRKNTTRQGSNGYVKILKCKDCHKILEQEKVKDGKMDVDDVKSGKKHGECDHAQKDWRGSTGTTWQWQCKDCGHLEKGDRAGKAKGKGIDPSASSSSATSGEADVVIELFNMTVQLQKEIGGELTVEQLDRVYEKCRLTAQGRRQLPESPVKKSSSPAKSSDSPSKVDVEKYHDKTFEYGVHEGHTFQWVYKCEKTYVKSMVTKFKNDTIKDPCLKAFAAYCMARDGKSSDTAYMVQQESEDDEATELYVILDTGCNNTCHGSEWMVKYMKPEASPRWN